MLIFCFAITSPAAEVKGPSEELIKALIQVESSGNLKAIGDKHLREKAYGPLQVRQPVCDDLNRIYGTNYKAEHCLGNLPLSVTIFKKYVTHWGTKKRLGREPRDADFARIWNGGPNGWKWSATEKYLAKVERALGQNKSVYVAKR